MPFSRSQSFERSMSPSFSRSAFLQSIIPAPVIFRSAATSFAETSAIASHLRAGVGGRGARRLGGLGLGRPGLWRLGLWRLGLRARSFPVGLGRFGLGGLRSLGALLALALLLGRDGLGLALLLLEFLLLFRRTRHAR